MKEGAAIEVSATSTISIICNTTSRYWHVIEHQHVDLNKQSFIQALSPSICCLQTLGLKGYSTCKIIQWLQTWFPYFLFRSGGYESTRAWIHEASGLLMVQWRAVLPSMSTSEKSHSATQITSRYSSRLLTGMLKCQSQYVPSFKRRMCLGLQKWEAQCSGVIPSLSCWLMFPITILQWKKEDCNIDLSQGQKMRTLL